MTATETNIVNSTATAPDPTPGATHPPLPAGPLRLTFELGERSLAWSAVSRRKNQAGKLISGAADIGYADSDQLFAWFESFREELTGHDHAIYLHISGPEIVRRSFMIPVVPKKELDAVVRSHAKRAYPFDITSGLFGWKVIDKVEWAGGLKYEIYSQALADHWHEWLPRLFGDLVENVRLITCTGEQFEYLLANTSPAFAVDDSYFIRVKNAVLETGFYHRGQLEFFREVIVERLYDYGSAEHVKELVGIVGSDAAGESAEKEAILGDIRSTIGDALDYYHGQFGQRAIKTVYICLPEEFTSEVSDYVRSHVVDHAVDLCSAEQVELQRRLSGITSELTNFPLEISLLPKKSIPGTLVNLLPESVRKRNQESLRFRRGILSCLLIVLTIVSLSLLKQFQLDLRDQSIREGTELAKRLEASPILEILGDYEERARMLHEQVASFDKRSSTVLTNTMRLLSHSSQNRIRLDNLKVRRGPGGRGGVALIGGRVTGSAELQQAALFRYVTALEAHSLVEKAMLMDKSARSQFGRQTTRFQMEVNLR